MFKVRGGVKGFQNNVKNNAELVFWGTSYFHIDSLTVKASRVQKTFKTFVIHGLFSCLCIPEHQIHLKTLGVTSEAVLYMIHVDADVTSGNHID